VLAVRIPEVELERVAVVVVPDLVGGDAMDGGGILILKTSSAGDSACIEVKDTGQGIASDHLSRIYDPFFTTKMAKKGTGLGLSVTYGIVREHGGSIEVQSEPGAGTLFHLEFPFARKPVNA